MTSHEETWTVVEADGERRWDNGNPDDWTYSVLTPGRRHRACNYPLGTVLRIVARVEIVEPG